MGEKDLTKPAKLVRKGKRGLVDLGDLGQRDRGDLAIYKLDQRAAEKVAKAASAAIVVA